MTNINNEEPKQSFPDKLKHLVIGKPHSPYEPSLFKNLSLIAFFAWVGLGADGLSSSCYGPSEAFMSLGRHMYLSIFVALATALTIIIIATSYSQIIELFPTGGGGYLVASKLLSPNVGMVSGCALIIDYVLTITVSVASGTDALFSFLPAYWYPLKLEFSILILGILIVLNLRGVKESVLPLIPIFLVFIFSHVFIILYSVFANTGNLPHMISGIQSDVSKTHSEIGYIGMLLIILRAYSMGAGTYTGIEAVSNGMSMLREPKVKTAKRTMRYMAASLAFVVVGLMVAYLIYGVVPQHGKTLNAVLFENATAGWGHYKYLFIFIILFSEATLLYVAAQTGFLGGPSVLANMALDRWFPTRFSMLSDRFINKNGILIMGLSAMLMMALARGSVTFLVVLYSINVFITFSLSQLGMVRHWLKVRDKVKKWKSKITINGIGLVLTVFILLSMVVLKFNEGGWITLFVTGALVVFAVIIKRHYINTAKLLQRLNALVLAADAPLNNDEMVCVPNPATEFNFNAKTAVLLVSGYNGIGLHTLFAVARMFEGVFKNYIFVQVGVIDSGNFKGAEEVTKLEDEIQVECDRYVNYMRKQGHHADSFHVIGTDVIAEIGKIAPKIMEQFPNAVFFSGQLVFPEDNYISRWLHNYTAFAMQRRFYSQGIPFVLLPIRIEAR
jgi:amino acid transporter